jgi:hypothetical protein
MCDHTISFFSVSGYLAGVIAPKEEAYRTKLSRLASVPCLLLSFKSTGSKLDSVEAILFVLRNLENI